MGYRSSKPSLFKSKLSICTLHRRNALYEPLYTQADVACKSEQTIKEMKKKLSLNIPDLLAGF